MALPLSSVKRPIEFASVSETNFVVLHNYNVDRIWSPNFLCFAKIGPVSLKRTDWRVFTMSAVKMWIVYKTFFYLVTSGPGQPSTTD